MKGSRGQTTQDFAIGVSVLLVTVIGAFVFTQGGALSVYEGTSPGVDQPQADRIASYIVENYSAEGERNTLRYGGGTGTIDGNLSNDESAAPGPKLDNLIEFSGTDVSSDRRIDPIVNVSIVNSSTLERGADVPARDSGRLLAWGEYRRSESVSSSRVVDLTNDGTTPQCTPVCWVVVRVW